jgi:cardiolipin synthase
MELLSLFTINVQWVAGIIFLILYLVTVLGLSLVIIAENRNPLKSIAWIIVILLAPGVGLLFYFFFGQDNRKQRIISRRTYKRIMKRPHKIKLPQEKQAVPEEYKQIVTLINNSNQSELLYGSKIEIFTGGKDKFESLMNDLRSAEHHIHIQYYIFCDDEIGNQVKDILISKAKEGVEVRVLYDDVGCWNVKQKFFNEMKDAGVEVYAFLKVVFPIFSSKVNYRNHRKIVVIDGKIGYMGGMNIADRYEKGSSLGEWRDTHFRMTGRGVLGLQAAFLVDWYVVSKKSLYDKTYYPQTEIYDEHNMMQIVTSGPIGQWRILLQALIYLIANAKRYIYIQTPYFLPTEGMNQALQTAALSGVDVRLMLPKHSDTKSVNMATHSYIDDMIKAGVKIYFYKTGFLHSKLFITEDVTCIGSANMDFRSFEHNFEINAFVYDKPFGEQMRKIFNHDTQNCEKLNIRTWLKRPLKEKLQESFMRLFAPLL